MGLGMVDKIKSSVKHVDKQTDSDDLGLDSSEAVEEVDSREANAYLVKITGEYMAEARSAKISREKRNKVNLSAYHGEQDYSSKAEGQSQEFLPKTQMAVEQTSAFFKKAMIGTGDYFEVKYGGRVKRLFSGDEVRSLVKTLVEDKVDFPTVVQNGIKVALLQSLLILKVYPKFSTINEFAVEYGDQEVAGTFADGSVGTMPQKVANLVRKDREEFSIAVDLINPSDYFPDPSGEGLYEIHEVERDISYVLDLAHQGVYDLSEVEQAIAESTSQMQKKSADARAKGQNPTKDAAVRKKIVLREVWGTILAEDGRVLHENIVMTIANDKYVIRQPTANPAWHGKSPFVKTPLMSVPFSVWHKALYDSAVSLNFALNELFNLILDGGISEVWGVKQVRLDDLENPEQISGGVRQGMTLAVKSTMPQGQKVLETVSAGSVPQASLAVYNITDREHQAASLMNDLKLGMLPSKQVKATEVIEASQQSGVLFDSIAKMVERNVIAEVYDRSWALTLQYSDAIPLSDLTDLVGMKKALLFRQMQAAERFVALYQGATFHVSGLSATLSRVKDFQKIMALLQAAASNPILMKAFIAKYDPDKLIVEIVKTLNINPATIQNDEQENVDIEQRMKGMAQISQLFGLTKGGGGSGKTTLNDNVGETELPAEVNQLSAPNGQGEF